MSRKPADLEVCATMWMSSGAGVFACGFRRRPAAGIKPDPEGAQRAAAGTRRRAGRATVMAHYRILVYPRE